MMWAAFPATRELATHTILNLPTMQFPNLHLYGNPIFVGMDWGNFLGMTGVAIVLLVMSLVQFRYADVERG